MLDPESRNLEVHMTAKHEDYEQLVHDIVSALERSNARTLGKGHNNKILGASGHRHQIDVSVEYDDPPHLVLVECKDYKDKVGLEAVLCLFARICDIQRHSNDRKVKGVLVTGQGFESGAKKFAEYYGIYLDLVKDWNEWAIKIRDDLTTRPRSATAVASTSGPNVVITNPVDTLTEGAK